MEESRKFNSSMKELTVVLGRPHTHAQNYAAWTFDMEDGTRWSIATSECTTDGNDTISFTLAVSDADKMKEIYFGIYSKLQRAKLILHIDSMPSTGFVYGTEHLVLQDLLSMIPNNGDRIAVGRKKLDKDLKMQVIVEDEFKGEIKKLVFAGISNRNGSVHVLGYLMNGNSMDDELTEHDMVCCLSPFAFITIFEYLQYYCCSGVLSITDCTDYQSRTKTL